MADRDEAEQLTQDAFVQAWRKLRGFRGDSAFSTWLHRVTVNVVLDRRRAERAFDLFDQVRAMTWRLLNPRYK